MLCNCFELQVMHLIAFELCEVLCEGFASLFPLQ